MYNALGVTLPEFESDLPLRPADALSIPELRALARRLAADTSGWRHLVRHHPAARVFERIVDEPAVEAWLICWMHGHDTGFHDHDLSSGAVAVLEGQVREERLILGSASARSVEYSAGELFDFSPADIHRVVHHGDAPTVTLHVYSPRIARPGAYSIGPDGTLRRHQVSNREELRPLEAV
jgi:predicted metal-dependent enzyme (double-stranded beta helix superfamily)